MATSFLIIAGTGAAVALIVIVGFAALLNNRK